MCLTAGVRVRSRTGHVYRGLLYSIRDWKELRSSSVVKKQQRLDILKIDKDPFNGCLVNKGIWAVIDMLQKPLQKEKSLCIVQCVSVLDCYMSAIFIKPRRCINLKQFGWMHFLSDACTAACLSYLNAQIHAWLAACMYGQMHACTASCMHDQLHACTASCMHVRLTACMASCMHVRLAACMASCIHVRLAACMYDSMHVLLNPVDIACYRSYTQLWFLARTVMLYESTAAWRGFTSACCRKFQLHVIGYKHVLLYSCMDACLYAA